MAGRVVICLVCPASCAITVTKTEQGIVTVGDNCKRGRAYAEAEFVNPLRTFSTSVRVVGGDRKLLSLKPDKPVPKDCIKLILSHLSTLVVKAPVVMGQVVLTNVGGLGVDLVALHSVKYVQV